MRTRKRTVYYCDFCNKKLMRRDAMESHEKHCTMNPNRECRMCDLNGSSNDMQAMLVLLEMSNANEIKSAIVHLLFDEDYNRQLLALYRKITHNCPACILALSRQYESINPTIFDYQKEARELKKRVNTMNLQELSEATGIQLEP